jgi:hypothetical protein
VLRRKISAYPPSETTSRNAKPDKHFERGQFWSLHDCEC